MAVLNKHRIVVMFAMLLLGIGAGVASQGGLCGARQTAPKMAKKQYYVLVAKMALDAQRVITKDLVEVKAVEDSPALTLSRAVKLDSPDALKTMTNKYLKLPKSKGSLITVDDLTNKRSISSRVLAGERGYTFRPKDLKGWSHKIKPNDWVDLYWVGKTPVDTTSTVDRASFVFLQHIKVLDVESEGGRVNGIVLSMSTEEIGTMLALDGQFHLAVRHRDDIAVEPVYLFSNKKVRQDIEVIQVLRRKRYKKRHHKKRNRVVPLYTGDTH